MSDSPVRIFDHTLGAALERSGINQVDGRYPGPVRSSEREGRIQSAERAVPTLSSYNLTNLLSA